MTTPSWILSSWKPSNIDHFLCFSEGVLLPEAVWQIQPDWSQVCAVVHPDSLGAQREGHCEQEECEAISSGPY